MDNIICSAHASQFHGVEFIDHQQESDKKWDKNPMFYDVINECSSLSMKDVRIALNFSMTTWDVEIDLDFHPVWFKKWRKNNPDITIEFRNASNDQYFKDRPSVLAYAFFPGQSQSGIIVFNDDYIWGMDGGEISVKEARVRGYPIKGNPADSVMLKIYSIVQVLIHELGHMLGLYHDVTGNQDGVDVMDAFYSGTRYDLSDRDIYRIHLKYIVEPFENWSRYALFKRWLKLRVRRF